MKECTKCKETKPLKLFTKRKTSLDGRGSWCRYCQNLYSAAHKYKTTENKILEIWNAHNCEICGCEFTPGNDVCVDHNHRTGAVRGALCQRCNRLLGFIEKDNFDYTKFTDYVNKYN